MLNKQQVVQQLQSQKKYLQETFGLTKIGLFGSVSRGDNRADSDIDILFEIDDKKKFSMFQYLKLNKFLEENLLSSVDLVRESTIKEALKPYIKKDLVYV